MSRIAAVWGAEPADAVRWLGRMLAVEEAAGERVARAERPGAAVGWRGLPGTGGVAVGAALTASVTGAFGEEASASLDGRGWRLVRGGTGAGRIWWTRIGGAVVAASTLRQLAAIPEVTLEVCPSSLMCYLSFGFFVGDRSPFVGIHGVPFEERAGSSQAVALGDPVDAVRIGVEAAVADSPFDGLLLSGGLDSAVVAACAARAGRTVRAFTLDLGVPSDDLPAAREVAAHLGMPLTEVSCTADAVVAALPRTVSALDVPLGDPVVVPRAVMLATAAAAGVTSVADGELGDQLFGGWTSKPLIAAAAYAGDDPEALVDAYLQSWHRFAGEEAWLVRPELLREVGGAGGVRELHRAFLAGDGELLGRVRRADLTLKGRDNLLPRAARLAAAHGLRAVAPLADPRLVALADALPGPLKVRGTESKWVFKQAALRYLPEALVYRRKQGMGVPVTSWLMGPMAPLVAGVLSDEAVRRRGWFRPEAVASLRAGEDKAGETRRRRAGERLWAVLALELWARWLIDGRGRR